jgi:pimeloyl-ACP methyl ester carboxylesterase
VRDNDEQPARQDQVIHLGDGRALGFAEYGPAAGVPLLLFHGLPGSRLAAPEMWAGEPGPVRVIAPDRPGFGSSSFQPGRRLTDWADDIRQLADALGLGRFLVAGFSGGGPHALAVAAGLPDRVIAVASIAGAGPVDAPGALGGMSRANRMIFQTARRAPWALRLLIAPNARALRRQPARVIARAARDKRLPAADRRVMADPRLRVLNIAAAPEAFRQGTRAVVQEARICASPWGFDPAMIGCPVLLWHGDADVNVPLAMARDLAARIPRGTLTICPAEGHFIVPGHWAEIVAELLACG